MDKKSLGLGTMFDKGGSHYFDKIRTEPLSTGYRLGHHPGKTKQCNICKKQKSTIGYSTKEGRFICSDCKEKYFKRKAQ